MSQATPSNYSSLLIQLSSVSASHSLSPPPPGELLNAAPDFARLSSGNSPGGLKVQSPQPHMEILRW